MWGDDFNMTEALIGSAIMIGLCYGIALLITP